MNIAGRVALLACQAVQLLESLLDKLAVAPPFHP
jgi:hypothetical protein